MDNLEISQIFRQISKILEIKNDNPFRIRAYARAAATIESLNEGINTLIREDQLETIPGIGKDLAAKIKEIALTGSLKFHEDLKKTIPLGLLDILEVPGLGPKTVGLLYKKLGVKSVTELQICAKRGRLHKLEGIREKTVSNILAGIDIFKKGRERISLAKALQIAEGILNNLSCNKQAKKLMYAGSARRMKETVRDIDILAASNNAKKIIDSFINLGGVKRILAKGQTRASIIAASGIQVDLRVVPVMSFGAALLYFTGSKDFNIRLRQLALKKKMKINEYGLFSVKGKKEKLLAGKTEEGIFKSLGLSFLQPELREDRGEVELAIKNRLPKLLELSDIKGDLHVHSNYSDGLNSISDIASRAKNKGYEYIAIADHSQSLKIASGLDKEALKKKKQEIERLNKEFSSIRILYAAEVDIDSHGELDYPADLLAEFDVVVAAIHSGFKQPKKELTQRIIKACKNKYVNIIAHPTGRLWGVRESYDIDFKEIYKVAASTNTALEINSFPDRLDLNDINSRQAKAHGVNLAINTDAHNLNHLDFMRLGVATARRGWIEKKDCINTKGLKELMRILKK
ncbi:MAG: DNA polymerase/3'-5' exonuclease PolX [Candidatus Omnitrophica bacterium]|nr:DNA polymerase/3'-5' exonuclease PolX [Candidatus Omnitrophota bacterium]